MAFQRVARLRDIPRDRGFRVSLGGIDIGLYRVGDAVHAMENVCPHAGAPLHAGPVRDGIVTCPVHGWAYDVRTGFHADHADGFPIPCFEVRLDDEEVWVDLERPIRSFGRRPQTDRA